MDTLPPYVTRPAKINYVSTKNCWFLSTLLYHNLLTVNSNATKSLLEFNGLYAAIYRNNILATFRTEILTKI